MHPKYLKIEDYTYGLPADRIAKYPREERDSAKLLIYNGEQIAEDTYRNIADHIPSDALLVFNQTKVVHARLLFKKPTGGEIEIFCLAPHERYKDIHTAMHERGTVWWECLVGGAAKWKKSMVLELACDAPAFTLRTAILERRASSFLLAFTWDIEQLTFAEVLHYLGKVPLPPYLHRNADATDEERYQTVYAKEEGSVAAPTAGLHFTKRVMDSLAAKNIDSAFVTLHVGAGTFMPVKSDMMADHNMHTEWIEVSRDTIRQLMQHGGKKIVAVGTTSLRTIESLYWIGNKIINNVCIDFNGIAVTQWEPYESVSDCSAYNALAAIANYMDHHQLQKLVTRTQILIAPGYSFRMADGLVTNFHQPQSTLLLLVAALTGNKWRTIYDYALQHDYRFLSYGDGSLLWRQ